MAFWCCYSLHTISLPNTLKNIGKCAFSDCSSLETIDIPNSVSCIEARAFEGCSRLENITIPDGVSAINFETFFGCENLQNITLPNMLNIFDYEAIVDCDYINFNEYDNAFYLGNTNNPYLVLFKVKDTNIVSCDIHPDTKIICAAAFSDCSLLNNIVLPEGLRTIGCQAFYKCESLESIVVPISVITIENNAFEGCMDLTINCKANAEPKGWEYNWNVYDQPVNWGVK